MITEMDVSTIDGQESVLTAQADKAPELILRPSLFVGNGGTGQLILSYLKAIFLNLHGHLPHSVRIVAFDTADENLSVSVGGRPVSLERDTEFHYIGRVDVPGIIQHIDNHPHIRERLPHITNLPPVNLLDGAGQVRPLGLLSLLWHIDTVRQALQDSLWELANRNNLGVLHGIRVDASRGINVFQVGSLCGGTNSGQFLDIAYLLRDALKGLGLDRFSEVIGLGVLPDAFRKVHGPNLVPNTVAALHELDHCMVEGGFKATYRDGYVVNTPYPPFNIYYLLSAVGEDNRVHLNLQNLCWTAALGLYHLAMTPIGTKKTTIFDNHVEALTQRTDEGHGTFFASFGLAELSFPATGVAEWCSHRHAQSVINRGLLSPPNDDMVQQAAEAIIQAQNLTVDGVQRALAVDNTDVPLAVELHPPVQIRDMEPNAVPQLAMTYVQNYLRENVEGEYRVWIRDNGNELAAKLTAAISSQIQAVLDDPARGLLFGQTFARHLSHHLDELATTLTTRRQALQAQKRNLESQHDRSLERLLHTAETNGLTALIYRLLQGDTVQEALGEYLKNAEALLQTQFELAVLDRAIAVVVAVQEQASAWARDLETLVNRLNAVDSQLAGRAADLQAWLLKPAQESGLALVTQTHLEGLYRAYAPAVSATVDALITSGAPLHEWHTQPQDTIHRTVLRAASQPFEPIRDISVEQVIEDRSDQMSPQQWLKMLIQKAQPAWNLNEVLLPNGASHLARIELIGVPDRESSIYSSDADRLVSTSDLQRITAFAMTAGAPFTAIRRYEDYQRKYMQVRGQRPLHILPDFLADGQSAKLAFALGHLFDIIKDRGVFYYYQPLDDLEAPIQLGRGKENAIEGLGGREGLVQELIKRVEAQIEEIGFEQARRKLAEFYEATGNEDELVRELKRLVRSYAQELREDRLV